MRRPWTGSSRPWSASPRRTTGCYAGLADEVARRFAGLSLGAHPGLVMRGRLPSAVKTATGAELPWEWLSAGAKDLLGLAVRLAMAGVSIGGSVDSS